MTSSTKATSSSTEMVRYNSPFGVIRELLEQLELATPRVDITHVGDELLIQVDLPGISPADMQVTIDDYALELEGQHNDRRFLRVVPLPQHVDPNSAQATFDKGVLEVRVRAPTREHGRRLEIKTGEGRAEG